MVIISNYLLVCPLESANIADISAWQKERIAKWDSSLPFLTTQNVLRDIDTGWLFDFAYLAAVSLTVSPRRACICSKGFFISKSRRSSTLSQGIFKGFKYLWGAGVQRQYNPTGLYSRGRRGRVGGHWREVRPYLLELTELIFSMANYRSFSSVVEEELVWSFSLSHGLRLTMPQRLVIAKRVQSTHHSEPRLSAASIARPSQ